MYNFFFGLEIPRLWYLLLYTFILILIPLHCYTENVGDILPPYRKPVASFSFFSQHFFFVRSFFSIPYRIHIHIKYTSTDADVAFSCSILIAHGFSIRSRKKGAKNRMKISYSSRSANPNCFLTHSLSHTHPLYEFVYSIHFHFVEKR